jgi:hypothetical protein
MIAQTSLLRPQSSDSVSYQRVRYEAPCDLLPWADPYIASLFAGTDGAVSPGKSVRSYGDEAVEEVDSWRGR